MLRRELLKAAIAGSTAFGAAQSETTKGELPASAYAVVELMGYKRLAGRLQNSPIPGLLQLDVPVEGGFITQMINPASIYRITICDQQAVKELAKNTSPLPEVTIEDSGFSQIEFSEDDYDNSQPPF